MACWSVRRSSTRGRLVAAAALVATVLAACAPDAEDSVGARAGEPAPSGAAGPDVAHGDDGAVRGDAEPARSVPLRDGERRLTVQMPAAYTPSAPYDAGSDDYRCFLLDPRLEEDVLLTGTDVLPGNPDVVHHVILFHVPPAQTDQAQGLDDRTEGQGWTCFGGSGVGTGAELDDAPWLGAWAPGGRESVLRAGYGRPMEAGSKIVMQVHYNLLAGAEPDVSATRLRVTDGSADLEPVTTMLFPAPVELPCRPAHDDGELCSREASMADVKERFGSAVGAIGDWLHLLCPGAEPGAEQSCTRTVPEDTTVIGVAGHMHLLGRSIRIELNPGTSEARTLLDVPVWDFDDQGARPMRPVRLQAGDEVRVTCEHDQRLRDLLPAFEGQPDRYVVWGEGTTDEMCLGLLQVSG